MFFARSIPAGCPGVAAATGAGSGAGMFTRTRSDFAPTEVSTLIDFITVPTLPRKSIVTLIGAFEPAPSLNGSAGNGGNCATVQPHDVRKLVIDTDVAETLVT